jgi:hypothetical protein
MYNVLPFVEFWLRGDSRTFRISDREELFRLKEDWESYESDSTSITVGYYAYEVDGGGRLRKAVIFREIETIKFSL